MAQTSYTLDQFREDPTRFLHDVGVVCVGVRVEEPDLEKPAPARACYHWDYWEVILMSAEGCVVVADYNLPKEWLLSPRGQGPAGDGVYVVPWASVDWLGTEEQARQNAACQEADAELLSYAL